MDNILHFAIIMLILSLASERLANFLKLQLHHKSIRVYRFIIWLFRLNSGVNNTIKIFDNLRLPENSKEKEKLRETNISGISLAMGIITATIFHIDLFHILQASQPTEVLNFNSYYSWLEDNFPKRIKNFYGYELQIYFTVCFLIFFLFLCWISPISNLIKKPLKYWKNRKSKKEASA